MAQKPSPLFKRIRDQIFYSGVVIIVIFLLLKMIGFRVGIQGLILSIILTVALNVGLAYLPLGSKQPPPPPRREPRRRANTGMMAKLKTGATPVVRESQARHDAEYSAADAAAETERAQQASKDYHRHNKTLWED